MKHLKHYQTPVILREVPYQVEGALLAQSIVNQASVTSMGQEVNDFDFSTDGFNHTWDNE